MPPTCQRRCTRGGMPLVLVSRPGFLRLLRLSVNGDRSRRGVRCRCARARPLPRGAGRRRSHRRQQRGASRGAGTRGARNHRRGGRRPGRKSRGGRCRLPRRVDTRGRPSRRAPAVARNARLVSRRPAARALAGADDRDHRHGRQDYHDGTRRRDARRLRRRRRGQRRCSGGQLVADRGSPRAARCRRFRRDAPARADELPPRVHVDEPRPGRGRLVLARPPRAARRSRGLPRSEGDDRAPPAARRHPRLQRRRRVSLVRARHFQRARRLLDARAGGARCLPRADGGLTLVDRGETTLLGFLPETPHPANIVAAAAIAAAAAPARRRSRGASPMLLLLCRTARARWGQSAACR